MKKGSKHSKESLKKIGKAQKGKIPWMKGKKHTPESILKIKAKRALQDPNCFKKVLTHEQRLRISIATKKGMANPIIREKLSKAITIHFNLHPEAKEHLRLKRLNQKNMPRISSIEIKICDILKTLNIDFVQQFSIKYKDFLTFVDIYIPSKKLCIYCDGDYWHNLPGRQERDRIINSTLSSVGYKVIRLWEHDINNDIDKCISLINTSINSV